MNTLPSVFTLSAAEALVLQNPQAAQGRAALKVTLMELLARRVVTMRHEEQPRRFGRTQRNDYLQLHGEAQPQAGNGPVAAVIDMLRAAGASGSGATMSQVVHHAQRSFGKDLAGFQQKHVLPALISRGLVESYQKKVLGLFPSTRYRATSAGETVRQQLGAQLDQARTLPDVLDRDPVQAAALVATLGGSILLVDELKPHYNRLSQVLGHPGSGDTSPVFMPTDADHDRDLDTGDFGGFDFDFGAFDALDSSLDAFDSSFDSSADSGSDGGSDGGGSSD